MKAPSNVGGLNIERGEQEMMNTFAKRTGWLGLAMAALMCATLGLAGCGSGDVAQTKDTPCTFDSDCSLGQVCLLKDGVCGSVSCDFCLDGQVCYTNADGESSCSKPECVEDSECSGGLSCVDGLCAEASCQTREDCAEGKICNVLAGKCVAPPAMCSTDFDCPSGEICLDSGSCRPGCLDDSECAEGEICNEEDRLCQSGCTDDSQCGAEESCNDANECVCDSSKCAEGFTCDEEANACVENPITSCDQVTCGPTQACDPTTFECIEVCTTEPGQTNSCPAGQFCNASTGQCEESTCVDKTPEDCTGDTPYLNPEFCECVECFEDSQCGEGQSCNVTFGLCQGACENPCDASTPGSCDAAPGAPYCYADCCVECIGAADCPQGQICVDGFCGAQPSCALDPTVCPNGYECVADQCQPSNTGGACDVSDPTSCPFGQQCVPGSGDSTMGTCEGTTPGGCGGCNPDCTCDNNLTCNGFACEGCTDGLDMRCPGVPLCFGSLCIGSLLGL